MQWKLLKKFTDTASGNNLLLTDTASGNNLVLADTVSGKNLLLADTVSVNNLFLTLSSENEMCYKLNFIGGTLLIYWGYPSDKNMRNHEIFFFFLF